MAAVTSLVNGLWESSPLGLVMYGCSFNMLTNSFFSSTKQGSFPCRHSFGSSHNPPQVLSTKEELKANEVHGEGTRDKALRTSAREAMLEVKVPNS